MYLIEISEKTGLIREEPVLDGWMGIRAFKDIIDDPKLGLKCMTAIALAVDYASPIRYYNINDRAKKAMQLVTGSRTAFDWDQDRIQHAMNIYNELQYNPALEEKKMLDQLREDKLKSIQVETDDARKRALFSELKEINGLIKDFKKYQEEQDIYDNSPVRTGYKLTRLEQKILDKNSFYYDKQKKQI